MSGARAGPGAPEGPKTPARPRLPWSDPRGTPPPRGRDPQPGLSPPPGARPEAPWDDGRRRPARGTVSGAHRPAEAGPAGGRPSSSCGCRRLGRRGTGWATSEYGGRPWGPAGPGERLAGRAEARGAGCRGFAAAARGGPKLCEVGAPSPGRAPRGFGSGLIPVAPVHGEVLPKFLILIIAIYL